jgi:hypothetical protein
MNAYAYKIYRAVVNLRPLTSFSKDFEDCVVVDVNDGKSKATWYHVQGSKSVVLVEHSVSERSELYEIHPTVDAIPLLNSFLQHFSKDWELPKMHLFEYNSHVFARIQGKTYHAMSMRFTRALDSKFMSIYYGVEARLEKDYPYLSLFRLYRDIGGMLTEVYEIMLRLKKEEERGRRQLRGKPLTRVFHDLLSLYEHYSFFYTSYGEMYGLQDRFIYVDWISEAWETIPALYKSVQRLFDKALFYDYALVQEERAKTAPVARV